MPHDIYDEELRDDLRALIKEFLEDQPARAFEPGVVCVRQEGSPVSVALFENVK